MPRQPLPLHTPLVSAQGIITQPWAMFLQTAITPQGVIVGTHADRSKYAADRFAGVFYVESDRGVAYLSTGSDWIYAFGEMRGTIDPDQKPSGLGTADEGFLFYSTDFDRRFRWNGTAWERAPLEPPRGQYGFFDSNPGAGWVLCDGTAGRKRTKPDGTVETFTPSNLTGAYLKGAAAFTGTVNPAVGAGVSGNTGPGGGHDHPFSASDSTGGPLGTPATTSFTGGAGAPLSAASPVHHHDFNVSGTTDPETDHTHAVNLTADTTGEPRNMGALIYYRA